MFKCHHPSCRSGTAGDGAAWDEIGFLAFELGCDRRAATRAWLEEAGLWDANLAPKPKAATEVRQPTTPTNDNSVASDDASVEAAAAGVCADQSDAAPDQVTSKPPLLAFYESLSLSSADRDELKSKRGLSDESIDASGLRSNCRSNLEILTALATNYDEWDLVRCGLWVNTGRQLKPGGQFYGYGVVNKKKHLPPELLESIDLTAIEDDDFVWAWKETGLCNPVLIPYFDLNGELVALRPHKGFPKGQPPRLYLAGGRGAVKLCKRAVIVEGEFKAAALQSVLGPTWTVASVPGITMVKNLDVWGDILVWLKTGGIREVVVVFDNEEQANPELPHYKPQLEDRFEAEVWARVCATRFVNEGYRALVAHIPDEWRNDQGKADWDSALAGLLSAGKSRDEIATLFETVLRNAQTPAELEREKLWGKEAERSITNRVMVRTYEPALPWGGEAERRLAKHLRRLAETILPEWKVRILILAEAYENTTGHYYELKLSEQRREKLLAELAQAESFEQIKFLKLALKGTPSLVAPFRLIPCYVMVKPDGTRVRLVRLRNIRGETTGLIPLDSNSFTAPRDFRRWLSQSGNFSWHGGERQLQALQQDIDFALAFKEVHQVVCYGCERPGRLWILDDCAYSPDGVEILPDRDGIIWYHGKGYKLLRDADGVPRGEEDQSFRIKSPPRMHPEDGLVFDPSGKLALKKNVSDQKAALQELLGTLVLHLNDSYAGQEGAMLVAATVAFFAAPQVFADYSQFPGIWITGEKGSGKTYTAKWLEALHGLTEIEAGISCKTSSAVGVQIAMGQQANIPSWVDEYKESELRDPNLKGVIHGGFNRELPSKWSADGRTRSVRTSLLATGESTCSNAATMSRFISVVAAREKRSGSNEESCQRLEWLQQHRQFHFVIGRTILRNRSTFTARLQGLLKEWDRLPELAQVEPRARFTYGVSYASFMALNALIPVYDGKLVSEFRAWLIRKTIESAEELAGRVDVSQFWGDLLSAHAAGVFGRTETELQRYFKVMRNGKGCPPLTPTQLKDGAEQLHREWNSVFLFFRPGPVIEAMRRHKRMQGLEFPLDQCDLLSQMKFREYFLAPPSKHGHQKKFIKGSRTNQYCWGIDLDRFPEFGLRPVSDAEWSTSFHPDGDTAAPALPSSDWIDPRKGGLFAIVDALTEKELEP